ncbi:unnamed protein product [Phytomonas sp. Hart1]|nr:unnamed protein product [Phytomonas sp. Hart1]|eukprot:CCW71894.1 unnamed protein product [Phytomonas sp. isolate Hart1]
MSPSTSSETQYAVWIDMVAGGCGGSLAKSILSPIQRIVVLQQLGQHRPYGVWQLARHILAREGITGFWRGNLTSMIMRVPSSGLQLALYSRLKFLAQDALTGYETRPRATGEQGKNGEACERIQRMDVVERFVIKCCAGGLSAIFASAVVYPGEVVRLRLMSGEKQFRGIWTTCRLIYRETNSLRNFYRGFAASSIQRVPDILICFATYETVKYALLDSPNPVFSKMDHSTRNLLSTIVGGSLAALASIMVTFPLDVAKRRIGMSGQSNDKVFYTSIGHCLRRVYTKEGIQGLYAGFFMEAVRCVPQVILMWIFIEAIQKQLAKRCI